MVNTSHSANVVNMICKGRTVSKTIYIETSWPQPSSSMLVLQAHTVIHIRAISLVQSWDVIPAICSTEASEVQLTKWGKKFTITIPPLLGCWVVRRGHQDIHRLCIYVSLRVLRTIILRTTSGTFRVLLHSANADEWLKMTDRD